MKSIVLVVCLAAALPSPTTAKDRDPAEIQEAADHKPAFKSVTGAFFALSVPDMAESVQWYSEKLGLSVVFQVSTVPEVTVLEGGGLLVELIRDPAARPGPERQELQHGVFKAGFLVKHFDSTLEELRARGVTIAFGPFPAQGNQRANVLIRDNAGNLIQIFGD